MDRVESPAGGAVFAKGQGFVLDSSGYDIEDGLLAGSALSWSSSIDGDDFIDGKAGNDLIYAGFGEDAMAGRTGDDTIRGNAGTDTIYPGPGRDAMLGNSPSDNVIENTIR